MKDRNIKDNGKNKNIIIKFRVSPQEFEIIENRMSLTREISISSYSRKMAMNGLIINLDLKEIAQLNKSLINIGANINQIAKRVNATNRYYDDDIKYIKEVSENIWQSLKSVQSKDYILNPEKTDNGRLVHTFGCTADGKTAER